MTERQAWLKVAAKFATGDCPTGMCSAVHLLLHSGEIDLKLKIEMLRKIRDWGKANHKSPTSYYWSMWERAPRVKLARQFAAELKGKR